MQNFDINDLFDSPKFKALLESYENMVRNNTSTYFETEELIQIAEYYAGQNMAQESANVIQYASRLHPDDDDLNIYLSQIMTAHGKYDEAMACLDGIPDQNDREVIFTRCTILLRKGMDEQANELLEKIAFDEDYSLEVMVDIANVYLDEGCNDDAYKWLKRAYDIDPDDNDLKASLFSYYSSKKEYDKMIVLLTNMIEDDPYNMNHWMDLTKVYILVPDMEKAAEAVDFALAIDKHNLIALETKAFICLMQNNPEKSIEMMEKLRDENRCGHDALQILLQAYAQLDRFEDSISCSGMLLDIPGLPDHEVAIYASLRAYCNLMMGNYADCRRDIQIVLKADKEYPNVYTVMGELELMNENINEAQRLFAYAENYATDMGEIKNAIAMSFFREGYLKDSILAFEEMEQNYPEEMKKNYYFMAYAYYFSHSEPKNIKRALIKGAYYIPKFTEMAQQLENSDDLEERDFYRMAMEAKALLDDTGLPPEVLLAHQDSSNEDEEQPDSALKD